MAAHSLTRIGPLSLAKILAVTYAVLGLFIGAVLSFFSIIGAALGGGTNDGGRVAAMLFGVGAVVVLPLFYGCLGFVGGLIMAPLYNLVAKLVGGIEIELE